MSEAVDADELGSKAPESEACLASERGLVDVGDAARCGLAGLEQKRPVCVTRWNAQNQFGRPLCVRVDPAEPQYV